MQIQVLNPFDQSLIQTLELQGSQDVQEALQLAHQLHQQHPQGLPAHTRESILKRTAALLRERQAEFTQRALEEGGKPLRDSEVEVQRAIHGIQLAADSISRLGTTPVPMDLSPAGQGKRAYVQDEPIGVVVAISAFNHPLNLIVHQVVTAIAAGCPVIVKPALNTPLSCIALVQLIHEAGLDPQWAQVLLCEDTLAQELACSPLVDYLTFIGSQKVGWHLRSQIAPGTRIALEHGGIAPALILEDAHWDQALPGIIKSAFYHAGQVCVSLQRLYVHRSRLDEVLDSLVQAASQLRTANPKEATTDLGPLISPQELQRIHQWVQEAQAQGAQILLGGQALSETCYPPTILLDPSPESRLMREEVFGPVLCIIPFDDTDAVVQAMNNTQFHFQASLYTQDENLAIPLLSQLQAKTVLLNEHPAFRVDWMPFGGNKLSGMGTGGIFYSMKEMSQEKLFILPEGKKV